jgi:hypothetical protein
MAPIVCATVEIKIGPDTLVDMGNGESVSLTEFVCRMMEKDVRGRMQPETLDNIKYFVQRGLSFDAILPFYMRNVDAALLKTMQQLGIDPKTVFCRLHQACVRAVAD